MVAFTVEKADLIALIEKVTKAVDHKSGSPILTQFKIVVRDGGVEVTGTNLDQTAAGSVAAETGATGSFCVPAALLVASLKKAAGSEVGLSCNGRLATVSVGRSRFRIPILPIDDFPEMRMMTEEPSHRFKVSSGFLARIVRCVAVAASTDATRHYLNGVCLNEQEGLLEVVATDGIKLSILRVDMPEGAAGIPSIIVPTGMLEMFPLFVDPEISVELSDTFIRLAGESFVIASKLIDGTFPSYRRLLPTGNNKRAVADRDALLSAVRRVAPFASGRDRDIAFGFTADELTLSGWSGDGSEAVDVMSIDSDCEIEIGFSSPNILAALSSFESETVGFLLSDPSSPALLFDPEDDSRSVVVMPYALRARMQAAA